MKKLFLFLVLILELSANIAIADNIKIKDHFYIGIDREINTLHLDSRASKVVAVADVSYMGGVGFFAGYQINNNIAIEAGYSDTKYSDHYCPVALGCSNGFLLSREFDFKSDAKIVNLDSVFTYNFGDRMKFLGIAGLSRTAYKYTMKELYIPPFDEDIGSVHIHASSPSQDLYLEESGVGYGVNLGVGSEFYLIRQRLSLRFMAKYFKPINNGIIKEAVHLDAGIKYKF
jgi:hypothetical protein